MLWSPKEFRESTVWDIQAAFNGWSQANGLSDSGNNKKFNPPTRDELELMKRKFPDDIDS